MTHRSGNEPTSVVRCVVAPRRKLEGTNAQATQRSLRAASIGPLTSGASTAASGGASWGAAPGPLPAPPTIAGVSTSGRFRPVSATQAQASVSMASTA